MRRCGLLFALAILAARPACAAEGEWVDGRFAELAERVFDQGGVRVSNCHLEFDAPPGAIRAVPKCYVLNASRRLAEVRIDFVALDQAGVPVFTAALSSFGLADMNGSEVVQFIPISATERARIATGRVRVWASTH